MNVVLDSWAVMRYLDDEGPAADEVDALLAEGRPLMSWINLGELHYVLRRALGEEAALATVRDVAACVEHRIPDQAMILAAARIKADHPMAYADAFAAALAQSTGATLWTGDPELLVDDAGWEHRDLR